ncbi:class II fructose-bisphosphate aldolase [Candidatus Saccharibacteria bacterium]|nr:class II fructose-bisphosphate aldolase [Candidatus Saccharibacteria bacterium]
MMSLEEIKASCASARQAVQRAKEQKFALGAFNIDNQETLIAISRALQKNNAPALVEISDGEVKAMGLANVRDMVTNYRREFGIELYLNLDHSPTVEDAKAAIDAGYEFIHIDVSQHDHEATDEQIVAATREVVEYAKRTGAIVESEAHYFAGSSSLHTEAIDYEEVRKTFSTPEGVKAFVDATGVDTYAVAIGNLHGKYPVPKVLDIELLKRIRAVVDCNLSLHGGSGTPGHYFEEAIKVGVQKINVNSDMRIAYRAALEKILREHPDEVALIKINQEVYDAVQAVVEEKLTHYNSIGKALI